MKSINMTIYGHGMPLVLFHGWGYDSHIWQTLFPHLSSQYQVYLVDLPGFGASDYLDWQEFKNSLLNRLPERFAIAGWSMGGLFATRLAIEAPTRVTHLLNIASTPRFIQDVDWPGVERSAFQAFYDNLATDPLKTLTQFMGLQWQGYTAPSRIPSLPSLTAGLEVLLTWDLRDALAELTMPVCFLFGRLDTITPRKLMTTMQTRYPQFDYKLFHQAAHVPFLSHTELFLELLQAWLVCSF